MKQRKSSSRTEELTHTTTAHFQSKLVLGIHFPPDTVLGFMATLLLKENLQHLKQLFSKLHIHCADAATYSILFIIQDSELTTALKTLKKID